MYFCPPIPKNMLSKINLGLNIVLLACVIYLFQKVKSTENGTETPVSETVSAPLKPMSSDIKSPIVYINTDSLENHYEYFKKSKVEIESQENSIRAQLEAESKKLQSDAAVYQQQAIGMTDLEKSNKEEELMKRNDRLMEKRDRMMGDLQEQKLKFNESLMERLSAYLKKYNKQHGYAYIMGYQEGSSILLANDSLNITQQVIDGLNEEFKNSGK